MALPDLSLCMIVRNEARHLSRCLTSVQGLVREIVVLDTGSTDETVQIAERHGARIAERPWNDNFSELRNLTLRLASSAWILVLDADEELRDWDAETLRRLMADEKVHGYFLPFVHYVGAGGDNVYVTDQVCRLFRKHEGILFRGQIHEEVAGSIRELPGGTVAYADLPVHHYGYLDRELAVKNKTGRNLGLIAAALRQDPDQPMLLYALGSEYYQEGRYREAADVLLPLLDRIPADSGYAADLQLKTAYALQMDGRTRDALRVYAAGEARFPGFADLLESYAGLQLDRGKPQEAYRLLHQALDDGNRRFLYPSSSGSGTYRTRWLAGKVCERLLRLDEALEHYEQAVRQQPGFRAAWAELVPLALLAGRADRLNGLILSLGTQLPPAVLGLLVPAAMNARAFDCLRALAAAPQLPVTVRELLPLLLRAAEGSPHSERYPAAAGIKTALEALLAVYPDDLAVAEYLWASALGCGDDAAAAAWLSRLLGARPGLAGIHRWLAYARQRNGLPAAGDPPPVPAPPDLSHAVQLLLQIGAWDRLLDLHRTLPSGALRWSRLPQPLWCGLLRAPAPVKRKWCAVYAGDPFPIRGAADVAEWLLYAAVTLSAGDIPQLRGAEEAALRRHGGAAAVIALALRCKRLAAEAYPPLPDLLAWPCSQSPESRIPSPGGQAQPDVQTLPFLPLHSLHPSSSPGTPFATQALQQHTPEDASLPMLHLVRMALRESGEQAAAPAKQQE